jgi:8-oxo-dGTP pyrophosphatase MutT (NUDIX family)
MLLRDADAGADAGLEVFMLRRTTAAAFAGGMYVFPGGRVDDVDGQGDAGYVTAAIRECFEEAGVLLARDENGTLVTDTHPVLRHRHDVHDGTTDLISLCSEHRLQLARDDLVWVSHWITPVGESSRRFDTRFFVAVAPPGQTSRHDDNETIASTWVRPSDALRQAASGELMMMPPTIVSLEYLAAHPDAASALAAARQLDRPQPILPKLRRNAAGRVSGISLPSDDDYADLD